MFGYRKLYAADAQILADHVLRLSEDDRRSRFAGAMSERQIRRYFETIDWQYATVIGYFDHSVLRAAVELRLDPGSESKVAEAAFSVERGLQGKGIGTALMRRIVTVAQNSGVARLAVVCLPENGRMRHLAAKFKAQTTVDIEEVVSSIELEPVNPLSLVQESIDDTSGYLPILLGQWYASLFDLLTPPQPVRTGA